MVGVRGDQLDDPTPCDDWTVADLLAHVHQFSAVFTHNARKEQARLPEGLVEDRREAIPDQLDELSRAWREESAWQGRGLGRRRRYGRAGQRRGRDRGANRTRLGPCPGHSPGLFAWMTPVWTRWTGSSTCSVRSHSARRQPRRKLQRGSNTPSHAPAAIRHGGQAVDEPPGSAEAVQVRRSLPVPGSRSDIAQ